LIAGEIAFGSPGLRMQHNKRLIIGLSFGVCGFCAAAWSGSARGGRRILGATFHENDARQERAAAQISA
jgi:hypothetical protein